MKQVYIYNRVGILRISKISIPVFNYKKKIHRISSDAPLQSLLSPSDVFPSPSSLPIHCPCIAPNSEMAMSGRLKGAVNSATPPFWCTHNCSVANKILKRKEFRHAIYFQNQFVVCLKVSSELGKIFYV